MGRSLIIMLARMVGSPAQPSENVDVTAVGKDPLWKIARRTALVADVKGKHALKISEGAGMGLVQNGISVPLIFLCADQHFGTDLARCHHEAASEATVGCEAEDR